MKPSNHILKIYSKAIFLLRFSHFQLLVTMGGKKANDKMIVEEKKKRTIPLKLQLDVKQKN